MKIRVVKIKGAKPAAPPKPFSVIGFSKLAKNRMPASAAATPVSFSKEADDAVVKRLITHRVLLQVKNNLESYYENKDKKSQNKLLSVFEFEQRIFVKKDLADFTEKPKFELQDLVLFIVTKEGHTSFEVDDPIKGHFRINGQKIRFQHFSQYADIKKKIQKLNKEMKTSQHPLFDLLVPTANAVVPLMAAPLYYGATTITVACMRICPAVSASAGAAVTKVATTPGLKESMTKFLLNPWTIGLGSGAWNACMFTGAMAGNNCATPFKWVACQVGVQNDNCVSKAGDMQAKIVEKGDTAETTTTVIEEVNGGKCKPYEAGKNATGFSKQIIVKTIRKADILKANPEAPVPPATSTSKFHFEYQPNPLEPEKLIIRSVTESIKNAQGTMIGQRIWTADGANFKVTQLDEFQLNTPEGMRYRPEALSCTKDAAKKPECQALIQHFRTLGEKVNCAFENKEAVVDQLKKETKENEKSGVAK